ncbi:MAG TPA: tRNA pseudouridine(55) synthase TruB [Candidatus Hydrogenedentes bacterium]|nr:tRNA pseudouridine(55) synthase TruB [Candidatus Hydrogenedentota bacterium]HPG68048.1 tRNA pseudouridine(55) synthase TruB [Candidatus Hydrogenedentota bacterium]
MNGILLVDKPAGLTSHDVVDRVRKAAGIRRVGHTGTLDPRATGLLILCLGRATRLSEHLTRLDKVYEGAMRLGVVTDSFDLDGTILEEHPVPAFDETAIREVCARFTGDLMQVPPMVSAVKVGGERLYKTARQGGVVAREPRPVTVYAFDVLDFASPDVTIRVRCTSGTYVRSLCHDIGRELGCGAALASLRRMKVGPHSVVDAVVLDALNTPQDVVSRLVPMNEALDLPTVVVRWESRKSVVSGATLTKMQFVGTCPVRTGWVQIKTEDGELLAIGLVESTAAAERVLPKRVLAD